MTEPKKYILIQSDYTLSYNNEDCFVNDKAVKRENETKPPKDVCLDLQKSFYNSFLKKTF